MKNYILSIITFCTILTTISGITASYNNQPTLGATFTSVPRPKHHPISPRERISSSANEYDRLFPHARNTTNAQPVLIQLEYVNYPPQDYYQAPYSPPQVDPVTHAIARRFDITHDQEEREYLLSLTKTAEEQLNLAIQCNKTVEERNRFRQRSNALRETAAYEKTSHQTYSFDFATVEKLSRLGLNVSYITGITGTPIQHALQSEFYELVKFAAQNKWWAKEDSTEAFLAKRIIDFTDMGCFYNHQKTKLVNAILHADACWALKEILSGAAYGIGDVMINVYNLVTDPITTGGHALESLKKLPAAIQQAGLLIGKINEMWFDLAKISITQYFNEELAQEQTDRIRPTLIEFAGAMENVKNIPPGVLARHTTSSAIEAYMMGKGLTAVGKVYQVAKLNSLNLIKKLEQSASNAELVLAADALPALLANQSINYLALQAEAAGTSLLPTAELLKKAHAIEKEVIVIWNSSKELKQLIKEAKKIYRKTNSTIHYTFERLESEAKYRRLVKDAENYYETIRSTNNDIMAISKNTQLPINHLEVIKNHIFNQEYQLHLGTHTFDPCPDMAAAWQRLISNEFTQYDLCWLVHEYAESLLMKNKSLSYTIAHRITEKLFPWSTLIK